MNAIRTSLLINVLLACGCGATPPEHVHTETTSKPNVSASPTGDEPADAATAIEEAAQRKFELLIPTKEFDKDPETQALLVTFDDLNLQKVLKMELVTEDVASLMPEWMRSLDGKQVRIRGYMYPTFESENINRFTLIDNNRIMNFGPGWQVYQCVDVTLKDGTTTNYLDNRLFDVVGRFKIDLVKHEEQIVSLYRLEGAVIPMNTN